MKYNNCSLTEIYNDVWKLLRQGAEKSKSDFHTCGLSTIDLKIPKLRTVVLRRVIEKEKSLIFHTDKRSNKVKEILENNNVSFLFYSKEDNIQIRLQGNAKVVLNEDLFEEQWNSTALMSKKCYLTNFSPGSIIEHPDNYTKEYLKFSDITINSAELVRDNFAVIQTRINSIDWLYLKYSGHLRAYFDIREEEIKAKWLVP